MKLSRLITILVALVALPVGAKAAQVPPSTCANVQDHGADAFVRLDAQRIIQNDLDTNACVIIPNLYLILSSVTINNKNNVTIYGYGGQSGLVTTNDIDMLYAPNPIKNLTLHDFSLQYIGTAHPTFGACFHAAGGIAKSTWTNVTWTQCAFGAKVDAQADQTGAGSANSIIASTIKGYRYGMYTRASFSSSDNTHYAGNLYGYRVDCATGETRWDEVTTFGVQSFSIVRTLPASQCGQSSFRGRDVAFNFSQPDPDAGWPAEGAANVYAPGACAQFDLTDSWGSGVLIGSADCQPSHVSIKGGGFGAMSPDNLQGRPAATLASVEIANGQSVNIVATTTGAAPGGTSIQIDCAVQHFNMSATTVKGNPLVGVSLCASSGMNVVGNQIIGAKTPIGQPAVNTNVVQNNTLAKT